MDKTIIFLKNSIKNFKFCLIISSLVNIVLTQNFNYQEGDWFVIPKSKSVNSITETAENILFGTDNGIFLQNRFTKEIIYDFFNSQELISKRVYHILYDKNTDYYWVVHDLGISYKASISRYWRNISFSEIKLNSFLQIKRIGYSSEAIWLDYDFGSIALDRFNGNVVNVDNISPIHWCSSKNENYIDIFNYNFSNDWIKTSNKIINRKSNIEYIPTIEYENNFGENWLVANSGLIFYGKYGWLESAFLGIPQNNITEVYLDEFGSWWFASSSYKNNNFEKFFSSSFLGDAEIFLTHWDENENKWNYYYNNESVSIKDYNINKILRVKDKLYLGTLDGLLILDISQKEWSNLNKNLYDKAVWDMALLDDTIYIATSNGINKISLFSNIILSIEESLLRHYIGKEIYKLIAHNDELYIMSEIGLEKVNFKDKSIKHLSSKFLKDFELDKNRIFINDGKISEILYSNDLVQEKYIYNEGNDICISDNFIWTTINQYVKLIDMDNGNYWTYSNEDGILGDIIYNINCDTEWVWFSTNKGISYYNWRKFH